MLISPTNSNNTIAKPQTDDFALKTRDMNALQKPSKRDYESVRTWFEYEEPIVRREAQFIRGKEDMVTLRVGRECAGFDGFIERLLGSSDRFLQKWFYITAIRVGMIVLLRVA